MLRTLTILAGCFVLTGSMSAAVISRDWVTPGDGLLTYDTLSGLEWLDLSQTLMGDYPGVTFEDRFQAVVAKTASGERFEGFRVATVAEAKQLILSSGINPTTNDFAINGGPVNSLIELISPTMDGPRLRLASGALDELFPATATSNYRRGLGLNYDPPRIAAAATGNHYITSFPYSTANFDPERAVFLVRISVPEPGSILAASLAIVLIVCPAKRALRTKHFAVLSICLSHVEV